MLLINLAQQAVEELCVIIVRCGAIRWQSSAAHRQHRHSHMMQTQIQTRHDRQIQSAKGPTIESKTRRSAEQSATQRWFVCHVLHDSRSSSSLTKLACWPRRQSWMSFSYASGTYASGNLLWYERSSSAVTVPGSPTYVASNVRGTTARQNTRFE
jgi:hypothetical protein